VIAKPCPICGQPPKRDDWDGRTVTCTDCYDYAIDTGANIPIGWGRTLADAIEDWNDSLELYV